MALSHGLGLEGSQQRHRFLRQIAARHPGIEGLLPVEVAADGVIALLRLGHQPACLGQVKQLTHRGGMLFGQQGSQPILDGPNLRVGPPLAASGEI